MTKERIDELFRLFDQEEIEPIVKFSGLKNADEFFGEEFEKAILTAIAAELEECNEEEFKYFNEVDNNIKIDIMECFNDKEKIKKYIQDNPQMAIYNKVRLLKATEDSKYIEEYLESNLELDEYNKIILVKATNDPQYIEKYIENNSINMFEVIDLLKLTKDFEYIKQYIEENPEMEFDYKIELIGSTGNLEYIKQYVEENSEMELDDKIKLIEATGDLEYIKQYIEENPGMELSIKIKLVKATGDLEYIKQYVKENPQLDVSTKIELLNKVISKKEMKQYIKGIIKESKRDAEITLPKDMTIGIEIETENEKNPEIGRLSIYPKGWKAKEDGSLQFGTEVVSPILTGTEENTENIYEVCDVLKAMEQDVSQRCGGHVHIGAQCLSDKGEQAITNFLIIYSNVEDLIYIIGNAEGVELRNNVMTYAKPILDKIDEISEDGSIELDSSEDVVKLVDKLKKNGNMDDRYQGLNLTNIGKEHKNTIEFRISNGTVDAKTWIENINLYGGLIASAREITEISKKIETGEKLTEEESSKMECFEKLQEKDITQEERLEALVGLEFKTEEQRDVYRRRYEKNKEFVKEEMIDRKQPIIFKTKDIGKKILPETNIDEIENADRRIEIDVKNEITQYDRSE